MPVIQARARRLQPWVSMRPIGNSRIAAIFSMLARNSALGNSTTRNVILALQASLPSHLIRRRRRRSPSPRAQLGRERERLPGRDERSQLRFLERGEERHARELGHRDHEPAGGLRHRLDQQHARHQRIAGEVAFEDGRCGRNARLGTDGLLGEIEIDDAVDELEILDAHARVRRPWRRRARRCGCTGCSDWKYCSVVALPSLTSCVHCSSGILIPNALSIANAMSRKSRLSMPRSLMAWLSGLIVSRGMSHVSEMILATVSKVEGISKSLIRSAFRQPRWQLRLGSETPRGRGPVSLASGRVPV